MSQRIHTAFENAGYNPQYPSMSHKFFPTGRKPGEYIPDLIAPPEKRVPMINQGESIMDKSIHPYPQRRSTQYQWTMNELEQYKNFYQTHPHPYFTGPILGKIPETGEEEYLEDMAEKMCRCRLHMAASYLKRALQFKSEGNMKSFYDALDKLYRVPFARCMMQFYGPIRQLEKQGLKVNGTTMGECSENYNLENIPTLELYAMYLLYGKSYANRDLLPLDKLPPLYDNPKYLKSIRPVLLQTLQNWQKHKPKVKATPHFRKLSY